MMTASNSRDYPLTRKIQVALPEGVADWVNRQPEPGSGPTGSDMIRELDAWTARLDGVDGSRTPTAPETRALGILQMFREGFADLQERVEAMESDEGARETYVQQLDAKVQQLESQARLSNIIINHLRDLFIISVGGTPPERNP
jgi:hypothetical protein